MAKEPKENDIVLYEPGNVTSDTARYFGLIVGGPFIVSDEKQYSVYWWTAGHRSNGSGALQPDSKHRACYMDIKGLTVIGRVNYDSNTDELHVTVIDE